MRDDMLTMKDVTDCGLGLMMIIIVFAGVLFFFVPTNDLASFLRLIGFTLSVGFIAMYRIFKM
ncbi:MAG: hypothetical protein ACFFED_12905 [Candidatus Thorarchaeota archaeon]